jgi:hypothetical protein
VDEAVEEHPVPGLDRLLVGRDDRSAVDHVAYLGWPRAQGGVLPAVAPSANCGVTM